MDNPIQLQPVLKSLADAEHMEATDFSRRQKCRIQRAGSFYISSTKDYSLISQSKGDEPSLLENEGRLTPFTHLGCRRMGQLLFIPRTLM